nr:hypothetical protein P5645_22045 [Bacillus subtilis]
MRAVIKTFPAETWPPEVGHLPAADLTNHLWVIFVLHVKRAKINPLWGHKALRKEKGGKPKWEKAFMKSLQTKSSKN